MSAVMRALRERAAAGASTAALNDGVHAVTAADLLAAVDHLAVQFRQMETRVAALLADNGVGWAIADLAMIAAGVRAVPLPPFFTSAQVRHAMAAAAVDTVVADATGLAMLPSAGRQRITAGSLHIWRVNPPPAASALPTPTQKITFTSGTTGQPKGVCLALQTQETVAASLVQASGASNRDAHLCALPLSTLLENIGGLYAPLLAGTTAWVPSLRRVGVAGASRIDGGRLLAAAHEFAASSLILVPQLLQALVEAVESGGDRPSHLRFVAVGGALVSPRLLERAEALGIPVYQGYGLSECASVVTLNTPAGQRPGSVGRVLPHCRLQIASDGEVWVHGAHFLGYTGEAPIDPDAPMATGDLGRLDDDGYLFLSGRKNDLFVTSFGRNVAPEWVERELCEEPIIDQAAVFGEARPWNVAAIVSAASPDDVEAAVLRANARLPDYARVRHWISTAPFTADNEQLTANGRLRRERIWSTFRGRLNALYSPKPEPAHS